MARKPQAKGTIEVQELRTEKVTLWIKGDSPLLLEAFGAKAKQQLLGPKTKTRADREQTLKHDPYAEFVDLLPKFRDNRQPTRLFMPAGAFKRAIVDVAPRLPGVQKTELAQMVWVHGNDIPIWGIPQVHMTMVRCADMNRTPDVRTRPVLSDWCAELVIEVVMPALTGQKIARLLAYAGQLIGIGGWRRQKGGNFGCFSVVSAKDCAKIVKAGGRAQQDKAIGNPVFFDDDTRDLYNWFYKEIKARGDEHKLRRSRKAAEAAGA